MSPFRNRYVRALPLLTVLAACGSIDGTDDPSGSASFSGGPRFDLTASPAVGGSRALAGNTIDTIAPGAPLPGAPQCIAATPQNCNQAKSQEEPPPPPPEIKLTGCTIQVLLESVTADTGQGATEGDMEMNVLASSGAGSLRWPSSGETPMAVGNSKFVEEAVAEYPLLPGEKLDIDVCATFTEDDDNGLNGASDVGSDCETLEISCKMAKTGSVPVEVSAPLCKGNKRDDKGNCKSYNGEASAQFSVGVSDEDWDNVPNDEDATPEPEDEACRGQEGRGVVLFLDFGSSDLNDLIGVIGMGVDQLVSDYDFVAIATDPQTVAGFTLRLDTLANADMVVEPTLEGLLDAFRVATSHHYDITFLNLGHGGADAFGNAFFSSADPGEAVWESTLDVALSPEVSGTCDYPFRAVTSLACYFAHMNEMWLDHGAKVAGGPIATNFYPQQLNGFGRHWNNGDTFGASVAGAGDPIVQGLNKLAIAAVGAGYGVATNCLDSVLGLNGCAEAFFTVTGPSSMGLANNGRSDYVSSLSGEDNMDLASTHRIAGFLGIDKFTPLTW